MTAPAILLAVLLALALLGQVRVGVRGEYGPAGPRAWLRIGPVSLSLWPRKKEARKKSGPPKKGAHFSLWPRKKEARKKSGPPKKGAHPAGGGKESRRAALRAGLDYLRALLPVALEAAGQFRRKLRVDQLFLEARVASDDPADAAAAYGYASAALGALWGPLNEAVQIKDGTVRVLPDLEGGTSSLEGRVSLSLTLAQLLRLGLHFGYKGLRAFLTVKGAHDRARKRKAV